MGWLMSNAFTYIHYINLGHLTKRNDGRALGTRAISVFFDAIMERQKRESLEAAIQSRIIDMRTISKYVSLALKKNCPR